MKNVNIKDIAKAAGVAVSTVSRVLNNHTDVKDDTKQRVLEIIKKLNYVPNTNARNLKRVVTNSIGIFVLGEYNPFFGDLIESLESEISNNGYSAIVHFHHNDRDSLESAVQFILEKKLIGLIYLGGIVSKDKQGYLENLDAPIVFTSAIIHEDVNRGLFSSVIIDEYEAVNSILTYLIELGHKTIGIITAERMGKCASEYRFEAYKKILSLNGLSYSEKFLERGNYSIKSGYDAMNNLLKKDCGLTAVFAVNDMMAIGAAKAVFDAGMSVPEDISIVGFDGLKYGEYFHPSLTTIKQPDKEFGKKSCELLFNLIKDRHMVQQIVLDTKLVVRESCKKII